MVIITANSGLILTLGILIANYLIMKCRIHMILFLSLIMGVYCVNVQSQVNTVIFAHRGGSAEYPENTIDAMLNAVSKGIYALELDVQITADNKVVVWHDPYLDANKVLNPDGSNLGSGSNMRNQIYKMTYEKLMKYDVGSLAVKNYKDRVNKKTHISLLDDLIDAVEAYTTHNHLPQVVYNIEIKSHPLSDNRLTPAYDLYSDLVMEVLNKKNIHDRLIIQSFDVRTLNYLNVKHPNLKLSYLLKSAKYPLKEVRKHLYFTPAILSPNYQMVNPQLISDCKEMGIQVIPWTVNKREDIQFLSQMGVDGIITDYPSDALRWLNK